MLLGHDDRRQQGIFVRILLLGLLIAPLVSGCARQGQKTSGRMMVAASIAPMADFSRQVGGRLVQVDMLVPPGVSPHTYQIEPAQMESLSRASVLVLNGANLEFWAKNAVDAAGNAHLIVVRTADGLKLMDGTDPDSPGGNPHVWVDPIDAIHQVEKIRDAFIKADPKHTTTYEANAAHYIVQLRQLDADIRYQVSQFKSKSFVSFHPTWVYFARRYGLTEAATIEESPGKEPSPQVIRHAIDVAKKVHAKAIFTELQMSPKAAEIVAEEAGAKVLTLNAFGDPPDYNYIKMMHSNVRKMAEALR